MNAYRNLLLVALVATGFAVLVPNAQALGLEEKIQVRFSNPVEVPGLVLPAGTYIFETLGNGSLTRILGADGVHVYTTLITVPDERTEPMEKATITFSESPKGAPERIEEWFYPGNSTGNEFIYQQPRSGKDVSSVIGAVPRETGRLVTASARCAAKSTEFLAVQTDHVVAASIGHALKALV